MVYFVDGKAKIIVSKQSADNKKCIHQLSKKERYRRKWDISKPGIQKDKIARVGHEKISLKENTYQWIELCKDAPNNDPEDDAEKIKKLIMSDRK